MKKLIILLICCLSLVGCADASAKISNKSEVLITINNQNYTRNDLYSYMVARSSGYHAIMSVRKTILDTEAVVTDEMIESADQTIAAYREMLQDSLEAYLLQTEGISSVEDYHSLLVQNAQSVQLNKTYVRENYETLATRYSPKQIQLMSFASYEEAEVALEALNNGEDFETVASENESEINGEPTIVISQSSYETVVLIAIGEMETQTTSEILSNDDESTFYIVRMLETDIEKIKDSAIETIASVSTISTEAFQFYLQRYNFTIYDIELYNQIKTNYPDFLNQ